MCAMEMPKEDETLPAADHPETDEIHGLEETQATFIQNDQKNGAAGASDAKKPPPGQAGTIPDGDLSGEDTARTVRLPAEPTSTPPDALPEPDYAAQTIRIKSRTPLEKEEPPDQVPSLKAETAPLLQPVKKRRSRWLGVSLLGLLGLGLIAILSGLGGYFSGIAMRQDAAITQVAQAALEQYELGVQDIAQGNYFRARQRFEYVIQLNPAYPGAVEKLADVLLELSTTATPTLLPTPTLSPTPDLRGVEELYNQGLQLLNNSEWSKAIDAFLQLRKTDPEFRKVEIDGQLFLALRHRARDKILNEADLEGGLYDLTLAQRFGIMDAEGQSLINWATFYITGASFWEIDWSQAAYYFGQVAPHAPNLRDKSGVTALERYRVALVRYASQLLNQKQFCQAQEQLAIALTIVQDPEIQAAHAQAAQLCAGPPPPESSEEPTQAP